MIPEIGLDGLSERIVQFTEQHDEWGEKEKWRNRNRSAKGLKKKETNKGEATI